MGFLRAGDLGAQSHERPENWVLQWRQVAPVVKGMRAAEGVLIRNVLIEPRRAEVFSNGLFWITGEQGHTASQIPAVGLRPESKEREDARVKVGDLNDAIVRPAPAGVVIGNKDYAGNSQPLALAFVTAKEEYLIFLNRAS